MSTISIEEQYRIIIDAVHKAGNPEPAGREEIYQTLRQQMADSLEKSGLSAGKVKAHFETFDSAVKAIEAYIATDKEGVSDASESGKDPVDTTVKKAKQAPGSERSIIFRTVVALVLVGISAFGGYEIKKMLDEWRYLKEERAGIWTLLCDSGPELYEDFYDGGEYKTHHYAEKGQVKITLQKNEGFSPYYIYNELSSEKRAAEQCERLQECAYRFAGNTLSYKMVHSSPVKDKTGKNFYMPSSVTYVDFTLPEGRMVKQTTHYFRSVFSYYESIEMDQEKLNALDGRKIHYRRTQLLTCKPVKK